MPSEKRRAYRTELAAAYKRGFEDGRAAAVMGTRKVRWTVWRTRRNVLSPH
jgi:hypothetical protein